MMNKKKLTEIKAEVAALLNGLPGPSPHLWLTKEIESAKRDPKRDTATLEMLCSALERKAPTRRTPKTRGKPAKR